MTVVLHIDSSIEPPQTSYSRRVSNALVESLALRHPDLEVNRRDLAIEPIPHVGPDFRLGWVAAAADRSPQQIEVVTRSEGYIAELKRADIIVIGAPMYNFSVPSTLKAWIDHVLVAGQTFAYTEAGPGGLVHGKKLLLALSRGGVYSEGPAAVMDHQSSYLLGALGFIGLIDVQTYLVEGTAANPALATSQVEELCDQILASDL